MPKVSLEHKQRRREEILEGAQRAFAQQGYEGATVARLEEETGLSRGAIFSYFENKEALFINVVGRSSARLVEIWLERGFRALLEAIVHEDPEWLSVQIEATRRVRTEQRFREQIARLDKEAKKKRPSRFERLQPSVREDIPIEVTLQFLSFVANGLAIARTTGDELPDLDLLNELVESGVGRR
jgi:TetR/AcrR family transcriptional regulator, transcriptional repressor of aconitase